MSDWYENMSRTPIRDRPLRQPLIRHSRHPFANPAPIRHSGEGRNPEGWGEGIVARGLVPRLGRAASSPALHHPAPSHFHPLMRPSQGHGDSGESMPCSPIRGRNPEGKGGTNRTQTPPTTRSHFHTWVCRHQPAWAIGRKAVDSISLGAFPTPKSAKFIERIEGAILLWYISLQL